jgi:hypothetical protein
MPMIETLQNSSSAEMEDEEVVVVTSLRDQPDHEIYLSVRNVLERRPKSFRWEIFGFCGQTPDTCLLMCDLLKSRDHSTRLVVDAKTSLIDAQLLYVLAADEFLFSPSRCFRFCSFERYETLMAKAKRFDSQFIEKVGENPCVFEYRKFLEIVDQYLPVDQLADRVWPFEKLKDFGLGLTKSEEESFRALFGND